MTMTTTRTTRQRLRAAGVFGASLLGLRTPAARGSGRTEHGHRDFAHPGGRLAVHVRNADLLLVPHDGPGLAVDRYVHGIGPTGPVPYWSLDGDTLSVGVRCRGLNFSFGSRYEVRVPRGTAVEVWSSNGDVRVAGLDRDVALDARDGDVSAEGIGGALRATVADGDLRVSGVGGAAALSARDGRIAVTGVAGHLDADVRDGDLDVAGAPAGAELTAKDGTVTAIGLRGAVTAAAGDGDLRLRFDAVPERLAASTRDGDLTVEVPKGRGYRVTGRTSDGARTVDVPQDPAGPALDLRSRDGDTTVRTAP